MTPDEGRALFPVLERFAYLNAGTFGPLARATADVVEEQLVADRDHGRSGKPYFERLLATHPQLSRRWLTSVSQRLARSHSRLTNLLGQPLEVQVAQLLLEEQVDDVVNLTQTTVAALLGVRRPSVNRVLKRFARAGMVQVSYGKVQIIDADALAAVTAP